MDGRVCWGCRERYIEGICCSRSFNFRGVVSATRCAKNAELSDLKEYY